MYPAVRGYIALIGKDILVKSNFPLSIFFPIYFTTSIKIPLILDFKASSGHPTPPSLYDSCALKSFTSVIGLKLVLKNWCVNNYLKLSTYLLIFLLFHFKYHLKN